MSESASGGHEEGVSLPLLPPVVREQVVAWAADALAGMDEPDVPASLRAVRRFTPAKRARLGATALAVSLERADGFRAAVVEAVRGWLPELVEAVEVGEGVPAAPAVEVAAVAYLLDVPGWRELAAAADRERDQRRDGSAAAAQERMREQLEAARAAGREEATRLRAELTKARAEADDLRRRLREAEGAARRAAEGETEARAELAAERDSAQSAVRNQEAEVRRLRARLADAEAAAATARRGAREAREGEQARLRVLLDTLAAAVGGLRRELDLPTVVNKPADTVVGDDELAAEPDALAGLVRGAAPGDPSLVDELLAVPGVHLLVDGYNVTKLGYGGLTLEAQRARLLAGVAGLAARASGAELTVVFDGTAAVSRPVGTATPRGVRVLFSAPGELADELILRLVRAEPAGRAVVVVTNDQEIAEGVRRAGGRVIASQTLLARLERG